MSLIKQLIIKYLTKSHHQKTLQRRHEATSVPRERLFTSAGYGVNLKHLFFQEDVINTYRLCLTAFERAVS